MSVAITLNGELMYPSKYIGEPDLKGHDVTLTIAKVQRDNLQMTGGRKEAKVVLYFVERPEKMLVCNKTNAITVAKLYGGEMRAWAGKRITLYPTTTRFGRETVNCVRIREQVPTGGRPAPQQQAAPPSDDVPGVVIPRGAASHTSIPDVSSVDVFWEFMEQTAQAANLAADQFGHGMSAIGRLHAIADGGAAGQASRLNVAEAASRGRLDWATGQIAD